MYQPTFSKHTQPVTCQLMCTCTNRHMPLFHSSPHFMHCVI